MVDCLQLKKSDVVDEGDEREFVFLEKPKNFQIFVRPRLPASRALKWKGVPHVAFRFRGFVSARSVLRD
jgi:hypothetical protein